MSVITLFKPYDLVTGPQLYDLTEEHILTASENRISLRAENNNLQYFYGDFVEGENGGYTPSSRVTGFAEHSNGSPHWSASGIDISLATFEELAEGQTDASALIAYALRGADTINGSAGDDVVYGYEANDNIVGYAGDDLLNGHMGNDFVSGHSGHDTVRGGSGDDIVRGGDDNDRVYGDLGNDTLYSDKGSDVFYGGAGADRFVFKSGDGQDRIADYDATDTILLCRNTGAASFGELNISEAGGHSTITFEGGDTLVVLHTTGLDATDFSFY